jgi:hypothetical protein
MQTIFLRGHNIIEVNLTSEEIAASQRLGVERTRLDEQQLGWKYRHHGKKSEEAHAIGDMGETTVEKWLQEQKIAYKPAPKIVRNLAEIEQDLTIGRLKLGVKTMEINKRVEEAFRYNSFLYPAKRSRGELLRVLDYPDFLIQVAVSRSLRKAWLIGFTKKEHIVASPVRIVVGKPAHAIPHAKYADCAALATVLRTETRREQKE